LARLPRLHASVVMKKKEDEKQKRRILVSV
jgi:hypothetical protein